MTRPAAGHGTRTRYVRGCRCGECRDANTAYGRGLARRHAAQARAVATGADLDQLTEYLVARRRVAIERGRRDEITRLLGVIEGIRKGRGAVAYERGPGRTTPTTRDRLDQLAVLVERGAPLGEALTRCGWARAASALRAAHRAGHTAAARAIQTTRRKSHEEDGA